MIQGMFDPKRKLRPIIVIGSVALLGLIGLLLILQLGWLVRPTAIAIELPVVGVDDAQRKVGFDIPEPTWLPTGLVLQGAHVDPPNWTHIFYGPADGSPRGLGIEISTGPKEGGYDYPDTAMRSVSVSGYSGICVQGSWNERQEWVASADAGALEWSTGDFWYRISHSGIGLSCENTVRIARSLR